MPRERRQLASLRIPKTEVMNPFRFSYFWSKFRAPLSQAFRIKNPLCLLGAGVFLSILNFGCVSRVITGTIFDCKTHKPVQNLRLALIRRPGNYYVGNPIVLLGMPRPAVLRTAVTNSSGAFRFDLISGRQLIVSPIAFESDWIKNGHHLSAAILRQVHGSEWRKISDQWCSKILDSNPDIEKDVPEFPSTWFDESSSNLPYMLDSL